MSIGKILIIEDQELISTNVEIILKKKDYEILGTVRTGEEALALIEKKQPDLALMDIALPGGIDGIETTKIINEKWGIPVVYLTAHTDRELIERAKKTQPYGFLTKDITLNEQLPLIVEFACFKHRALKEKQKAESDLRDSEEKFRSIASAARDAIFILDGSGSITFWNAAAVRIFGYEEQEALGKELYSLVSNESLKEHYKKGFSDFKENGKGNFTGRIIELDMRRKNGSIIPVELSLSPIVLKGEWYASGIVRDVSQRKNTESEMERLIEEIQISREVIEQHATDLISLNHKLSQSEIQLTELNASKDKFFSIIAHDLKGPFQGLLGYSEILNRDIDTLTKDEIKEFASDFHSSALHLFKLLENLLQWSRVQRGVIDHHPMSAYIRELVAMNFDLLSGNASQKGVSLKMEIETELIVYSDVNMANTIIRNLISNAIKFTPGGGSITVKAEPFRKEQVIISVADTGVGMEAKDVEKIFKIDSHHTTLGTNNEQGTGLGLILCKELVEKNSGKIWVESEPGKGTTFMFTLPVGTEDDLM